MNRTDRMADFIKIAAVLTAAPRWAGALMAADGVPVPPEWLAAWRWAALILSVGMAAAEGLAISYVFNAWRNQGDKRSRLLLWLAILMLVDFGLILAPYIIANVSGATLAGVLQSGPNGLAGSWLLWLWSGAVAASTGLVVGSVGYAQKSPRSEPATGRKAADESPQEFFTCPRCAAEFGSQPALNAHQARHKRDKASQNGKEPATIEERSE